MNFSTPLARLRLIGLIEGTSCILLFFVAMPLKHFGGRPDAVLYVGSVHGGLWVLYMLAVVNVVWSRSWPAERTAAAVASSIPPFATFIFDRALKREQVAIGDQPTRTAPSVGRASVK